MPKQLYEKITELLGSPIFNGKTIWIQNSLDREFTVASTRKKKDRFSIFIKDNTTDKIKHLISESDKEVIEEAKKVSPFFPKLI